MRAWPGRHGPVRLPVCSSADKADPGSPGVGAKDAEGYLANAPMAHIHSNVNPEHIGASSGNIGACARILRPEQAVVLETDPDKAPDIGRTFLGLYLTLPNYTNNFLRLGFQNESDFRRWVEGNRLVDAIIAWERSEYDPGSNSRAPFGRRRPRLRSGAATADSKRCRYASGANSPPLWHVKGSPK